MGQLVDGKWRNENILVNHDDKGLYFKRESIFRDRISSEAGSRLSRRAPDRYHLYCAVACPWAHRATLMRTLKKLEPFVTLTNTFQEPDGQGWSFGEAGHVVPGTDRRVRWLHELYMIADPACTTRVTVPTLWDAKTRRVVNNEFLRNHPHIQHGVFRHRGADAGLLSAGAAPRDRRDQRAGAQRREQRRQRLRLLDFAGGLRQLRQRIVRNTGRSGRAAVATNAICAARSRPKRTGGCFRAWCASIPAITSATNATCAGSTSTANLSNYLRDSTRRRASPQCAISPA